MHTKLATSTHAATATAVALLLSAALSGCSDNGGSSSPTKTKTKSATASPSAQKGAAQVALRSGKLGKYLTDGSGRTLYLFEADTSAKSTCYDACAQAWPPLTTSGRPKADKGVKAGLLGTTTRKGGKKEVTYNGHPLYYFQGDDKPGDTNGQELDQFGAEWYVLGADGKKIEGD